MENSQLSRRSLIIGAAALAAASYLPSTVMAALPKQVRVLSFYNTHTDEKLTVAYFEKGRYIRSAMAEINRVLRDHRSGDVHPMDPKLMDMLTVLHKRVRSNKPFDVISGYRSPVSNAIMHENSGGVAKKSLHMEGKAIDIRLDDRSIRDIQRAAVDLKIGGVGYYRSSDFVHIDTGPVRKWG